MTAWVSPSSSIAFSASRAVVMPVKTMPCGLSRLFAAAFSPLTNSRRTSCSSLMTRIRLTGSRMRHGSARHQPRKPREGRGARRCPDAAVTARGSGGSASVNKAGAPRARSGHCLDRCGEPALVARRRVLVEDLLVRDGIDDALRFPQLHLRRGLVARSDGLAHFLERGAQLRALGCVVGVAPEGLPGAFAGLRGVRHEIPCLSGDSRKKAVRILSDPAECKLRQAVAAVKMPSANPGTTPPLSRDETEMRGPQPSEVTQQLA